MKRVVMFRKFNHVCEILERHGYARHKLIPILQEVQEEYRYLPEEVMTYIATSLKIPPAKVFGAASFYAHFALEPKGKNIVKLCDGTACHVKGSIKILNAIRSHLHLQDGKNTTDDMLFTVETVSCLGACGLAPAVVVNEKVYGQMTPEKNVGVLNQVMHEEEVCDPASH